jgi:hypothetical protein
LNNPTRIHLQREVDDFALDHAGEDLLLNLVSMFEKLLDDIVAEYILHELHGVGLYFAEDLVLLIAVGRLQFGLDESRSVLIPAELDDVIVDVL